VRPPAYSAGLRGFALAVLARLGEHGKEACFQFCDDEAMREYNFLFRGKDESTDILTFDTGDIAISVPTLERNAEEAGIPAEEELRRLVIHGLLHLCGEDHAANLPDEPMLQKQESLLREIGGLQ